MCTSSLFAPANIWFQKLKLYFIQVLCTTSPPKIAPTPYRRLMDLKYRKDFTKLQSKDSQERSDTREFLREKRLLRTRMCFFSQSGISDEKK